MNGFGLHAMVFVFVLFVMLFLEEVIHLGGSLFTAC